MSGGWRWLYFCKNTDACAPPVIELIDIVEKNNTLITINCAIERKLEGTHIGLLRQITGKRARRLGDGTWKTPGAEVVREAAGTQSAMTYIGIRQATVAQWVVLRSLFKMCAREKGYEGGGRRRGAWWRQEAAEKQLRATLSGISREDKRGRIFGESVMQ